MIPKIIHYCWFGRGQKPELIKHCIASWKKYCPDYEIIEWNEDNFDVNSCTYSREAYEVKKWAFVSDYARASVLYEHGGIYLDTDIELFKPLDAFLNDTGFLGFESNDYVATAIMAAEKNNPIIKQMLDEYNISNFMREDNTPDCTTNVVKLKRFLAANGMKDNGKKQHISQFTIYKQIVFCPNTLCMIFGKVPSKTVSIHHAAASWRNGKIETGFKQAIRSYLVNKARNIIGTDNLIKLKKD